MPRESTLLTSRAQPGAPYFFLKHEALGFLVRRQYLAREHVCASTLLETQTTPTRARAETT